MNGPAYIRDLNVRSGNGDRKPGYFIDRLSQQPKPNQCAMGSCYSAWPGQC